MWHDLGVALALLLVLEGILPFANPGALRRALQAMEQMSDNQLRIAGLASMLVGLLFLVFINR
jgi:uncharacterized protein YjeT (DUF2065 family)